MKNEFIFEYARKNLDKKRLEKDKQERVEYEATREACLEEMENFRERVCEEIDTILRKYNMDTNYPRGESISHIIFRKPLGYIANREKEREYHEAEEKRKCKQSNIMFCLAFGVNSEHTVEEFMKLVDETTFD